MKSYFILSFYFIFSQLSVFSQNSAILNERLNILYKYAPNPIKIVVQNVPCNDLVVSANIGKLVISDHSRDSCHFIYWCNDCDAKSDLIKIGVKEKDKIRWIDSSGFRLFEDAKKSIYINVYGCRETCKIKKENFKLDAKAIELGYHMGLSAPLINWDIEMSYPVVKYSVEIKRKDTVIYSDIDIIQNTFTDNFIAKILTCLPGDQINFYNVSVKIGNCEELYHGPKLTIEE